MSAPIEKGVVMPRPDRRTILSTAAASIVMGNGVLAGSSKPAWTATGSTNLQQVPISPRNIRGKILYVGDDKKERGREWFGFTFRKDGQITLRAYCEMDDIQLERDVVYTMDHKFRPLDCFIRLHKDGKFLGTGWIRVSDTEVECEVFNSGFGRVQQIFPLTSPALNLGAHPLANDALVLASFDHSRPERVQTQSGWLTTSPLLYGSAGPLIGMRSGTIEYVGPERITVPAGIFDTHHYRFPPTPGNALHPSGTPGSEDIWVTHPHYTFVRAEVYGYLTNETGYGYYELAELEYL
ncbi:MAG: hypothetical protein KDE14_16740 [Rhodobacteraceae bacterium]|nr:hypothetical protein [Paracoccaceae bacterium]